MKKIAFTTLGCKANYVDTESMIAACRRAGIEVVSFESKADAYVVNTCTVTAVADRQSRQILRRPRRMSPNAVVVATGCLGEMGRDALKGAEVDAVFGTSDRDAALTFLFEKLGARDQGSGIRNQERQSRARAFLKIQDGCDRGCAYCIVPNARGPARSVAPEEIERDCLALARHHREIVLTGIDVGQYRWEARGVRNGLVELIERLAGVKGMPRLRLSSIDPTLVGDGLVDLLGSGKLCRHIHLSIQSGSDSVLEKMGRRYGSRDILQAVRRLAAAVPGIAITGDVIAGLPGEGEEHHRETMELLSGLPIAGLHVFPYSARPGTRAAEMSGQVRRDVVRERAAELRAIGAAARGRFLSTLVGETHDVIVTSRAADRCGMIAAFSDNAVSVRLPAGVVAYGEMAEAVIDRISNSEVHGTWESARKKKAS